MADHFEFSSPFISLPCKGVQQDLNRQNELFSPQALVMGIAVGGRMNSSAAPGNALLIK